MRDGSAGRAKERGAFALAVLEVISTIPRGRAMTYGDVANFLGSGSPRQVGQVLARHGEGIPWHRVVMADGAPAAHQRDEQLSMLEAEGAPIRQGRVDLRRARWRPTET